MMMMSEEIKIRMIREENKFRMMREENKIRMMREENKIRMMREEKIIMMMREDINISMITCNNFTAHPPNRRGDHGFLNLIVKRDSVHGQHKTLSTRPMGSFSWVAPLTV